jgi:CxxC motif-containing protein (DUF1111 family)
MTRLDRPAAARSIAALLATSVAMPLAAGDCLGDLDGSRTIDGGDLGVLLGSWGGRSAIADLDGSGLVDGADLGLLFANWGPCPCEDGNAVDWSPLHAPDGPREPDVRVLTKSALVTRMADRARDRHAREDIVNGVPFRTYDHWLPFYWEQRVAEIEIEDRVAVGGSEIVFRFMTHDRLNPAEFRSFYGNTPSVALYHNNMSDYLGAGVTLVETRPSTIWPGETEHHYEATINRFFPVNRPLAIGDRIEIELSQFLLAPRNGRSNYYGTAFLYVVGEGVVPWYAKFREEAATPEDAENASFDSFPVPEWARPGGDTTLPYQYSNEPDHRFQQTAGNISDLSGHPFMHGRRLHHTDFLTGAHSEPDNPIFAEFAGIAGPQFAATSCVACHVNNGRSLPPAVGSPFTQAAIYLGADVDGTPHPTLGEVLQPYPSGNAGGGDPTTVEAEAFNASSGVVVESCSDAGGTCVGSFDTGDWVAYATTPVTVATAGPHVVAFRVASGVDGGRLRVEEAGGSPLYAEVDIPNTGGDDVWTTIDVTISLPAGDRLFGLNAANGGFRLNWFRVSPPDAGGGDPAIGEGEAMLAGWETIPGIYGDGTPYELRRPIVAFEKTTPPYHAVRTAPPLVGLGLLEAVDEETILALADPCDDDRDGISGRARFVEDPTAPDRRLLGRFTAKGRRASVLEQVAHAFNRDMGVTTGVFPVLDDGSTTATPEVADDDLELLARYVSLLGVAARRDLTDADALHGETLFASAGCAACHLTELVTGDRHPYAELRGQTIRPYTDLLLHDLGPGLADSMAEGDAEAGEWRTAPLWSLGLTAGVSGGEAYLHDGRARDLAEAILWHGGEAEPAREAFRTMSAEDRAALIAFLRSL